MPDSISSELKRLGICSTITNIKSLSGGCISQAACYSTDKGNFFVKTNPDPKAKYWFDAESLALERINQAVPGFAPKPIAHSDETQQAYIVTEYIDMGRGSSDKSIQEALGRALYKLHTSATHGQFGFDVTSWCGTTELNNTWSTDWPQFYKTQRLEPLLKQVHGQNKDVDKLGASLCSRLDHWLGKDAVGEITPSLVHGDLWSGNWCVSSGKPMIFDPAAYYAHYEFEFGIMKMFGGFTQACFDAYDDLFVNDEGSSNNSATTALEGRGDRLLIYEAYHHLNHFAMFGGGYSSGFVNLIDKLL